jgi:hypothetical protein
VNGERAEVYSIPAIRCSASWSGGRSFVGRSR